MKNETKIAEILKRAQESIIEPLDVAYDCEGEEEDVFLEELSQKLQQGEMVELASLPKSLQQAFLRDLANGDLKHEIAVWTPWWLMPERMHNQQVQHALKPLVEDPDQPTQPLTFPCIRYYLNNKSYKDIQLPVTVSPTIPYNMTEVIYLYCLTMRLFNGDVEFSKEEIVSSLCQFSSVLSKGGVFNSMNEVGFGSCDRVACRMFVK